MAHTPCLVCQVKTVNGRHKNTLVRASASSRHITQLEESTFIIYLWINPFRNKQKDLYSKPTLCNLDCDKT